MSARLPLFVVFLLSHRLVFSQPFDDSTYVAENYIKREQMIPMRDGVRLFTAIYAPREQNEKYPFLMERTPYSCAPYGPQRLRKRFLGPTRQLMHEKYIFVYQDVRGRYKSEGVFEEMTPAKDVKNSSRDTDESSDTYDTIDWLLKNVKHNNGKVGIYGISYPGFYATASLPSAHPALKAVSPQAPVTDEFIGDDAYHHGAFFLMDNFDFTNYFQGTRIDCGRDYKNTFELNRADAYRFFLDLGPISHTNDPNYFDHKAKIWNEYLSHDVYDQYWKSRNIRTHLKSVNPAVLVVGGWFDAEDMFGALHTYESIDKQSPRTTSYIVMGPWTHGAWSSDVWDHFGNEHFAGNVNGYFQSEIETRFFEYYLKNKGFLNLSKATVFETGTNEWKSYPSWPPAAMRSEKLYLSDNHMLQPRPMDRAFDEYTSDPADPVPYTNGIFADRNNEYMIEDQRFAAKRQDVLAYQTDPFIQNSTVTGPIRVDFFISSTGTDADLVVKIIDVWPSSTAESTDTGSNHQISGLQELVRADVFRCKFRRSYEIPQPLRQDHLEEISFDLNDICHTFKSGHRLMVQVQSSWFPLVDRNPQVFTDIPTCRQVDFQKASIRVYHTSSVELPLQQ